MNDRDMNNIHYILSRTPEELMIWWDTLSEDDQSYAVEIVMQYKKELESISSYDSEKIDVTEAKNYLKKFQL